MSRVLYERLYVGRLQGIVYVDNRRYFKVEPDLFVQASITMGWRVMDHGEATTSTATTCSSLDNKTTDPRWLFAQPLLAFLPSVSMSNQPSQPFLMQPDATGAIPLQYLQAGAVPFNLLTQLQQQATGQQFNMAAHNNLPVTTATGESPAAPQTPGSASLGSPPAQVAADNTTTPRSGTPATPSHTPSNLELQMQQLVQNQQVQWGGRAAGGVG